MVRVSQGITVLPAMMPSTHEPYLPLLPIHRASPPFGWHSATAVAAAAADNDNDRLSLSLIVISIVVGVAVILGHSERLDCFTITATATMIIITLILRTNFPVFVWTGKTIALRIRYIAVVDNKHTYMLLAYLCKNYWQNSHLIVGWTWTKWSCQWYRCSVINTAVKMDAGRAANGNQGNRAANEGHISNDDGQ